MVERFSFYLSVKRTVCHLRIAVGRTANSKERAEVFEELSAALHLIREYSPEKFSAMQKDISVIFVHGYLRPPAQYVPKQNMIQLNERYILDPRSSRGSLACVLIHEAQHARLFRLGFGYDQTNRIRIERLCFRAERSFARRLPDGRNLVSEVQAFLDMDLEAMYSKEGRLRADLRGLRDVGCPDWLVRTLEWIARRRGLIAEEDGKGLDSPNKSVDI